MRPPNPKWYPNLQSYYDALKQYAAYMIINPVKKKQAEICGCGNCSEQYQHKSDCAVHNEPAMPNGECDCRQIAID